MTSDQLPPWPALDLGGQSLPGRIDYELGVWGKLHGAPTDYRWIAESTAFDPGPAALEEELQLGSEDAPRRSVHWRVLGDRCFAMAAYPSRAEDAAGRSSFLEKQVLDWRRPPGTPAALGALVLLPRVAQSNDQVWWDRQSQNRWTEDDESFSLLPDDHAPLPVSAEGLGQAIARGVADLKGALSESVLTDLYAHLLAGQRAIPLALSAPLSPEAVAVLLLPLPRALADTLSLAGWLPSQRIPDIDALRRCWNLVLGGAVLPPAPTGTPSPAHQDRARAMARALLANDPSLAGGSPAPTRPVRLAPRTNGQIQLAMWGPSSAGKTALLAKLYLEEQETGWEIFPTEGSLPFIENMRSYMRTNNSFPPATTTAVAQIEYLFRHQVTAVEASLRLEDRRGSESETLSDDIRRQLGEAHGLVLLFDPMAEAGTLESLVWRTLEHVHVASGRGVQKDERPIAVCVSKADVLIESIDDFRSAQDDPDGFVRRHDRMGLVRALDRFCSNYRLFPVSAAGVRVRHGVVEPVVFYDETLRPRLCPGGRPLNVMAPFAWLLDQATSRS
jgi:hypothetical protein